MWPLVCPHFGTEMPNRKMDDAAKVDHWNRRAEEVRQKALLTEVTQHLKRTPSHLEPVASKLRSMGVKFRADDPKATAREEKPKATSNYLEPGIPLEQVAFGKLRTILLNLDKKYCNEAHLRACKEGKARDISKDGVLRLLELVTGVRRSFVVTKHMTIESDCLALWKSWYDKFGQRFRVLRLPIDYSEEGAFSVTKEKGKMMLKSIEHECAIDLTKAAGVVNLKGGIRFEENWGKHATLVVGTQRFDCARFFPMMPAPCEMLALEDGDAEDGGEPPHHDESQVAASSGGTTKDNELVTPTPTKRRKVATDEEGDPQRTDTQQPLVNEANLAPPPPLVGGRRSLPPTTPIPLPALATDTTPGGDGRAVEDDDEADSFSDVLEKVMEAEVAEQDSE